MMVAGDPRRPRGTAPPTILRSDTTRTERAHRPKRTAGMVPLPPGLAAMGTATTNPEANDAENTEMDDSRSGSLDHVPAGTFRGGDEIPAITFH